MYKALEVLHTKCAVESCTEAGVTYNSDLPLLRHSSEIMLKDSNGFDLDHDLGQDQGPIGIAMRT